MMASYGTNSTSQILAFGAANSLLDGKTSAYRDVVTAIINTELDQEFDIASPPDSITQCCNLLTSAFLRAKPGEAPNCLFSWIFFPSIIPGGAATLSDIMFLAKKEFDGKLKTDEGTISATGDIASITASSGKDLYLAKAKVSIRLESGGTAGGAIVELKVNGVIKATWAGELLISSGEAAHHNSVYEFVVSGLKVTATQIIKIEAVTVDADIEVNGELICFEEDTGVNPLDDFT